ncbi:MAG: hypothetical protein U5K54_04085 [Cytophagales bacterium]|nr:hypothetical protein [Cytophagales bacterium]
MEKLVLKGKKEIRLLLVDSLHQTVQALGVSRSKKRTEKTINKSARRIADLVTAQMKKEIKEIKKAKVKVPKIPKEKKLKKAKLQNWKRLNIVTHSNENKGSW